MFNRLGFQCTCCGAPLTGGLDTFGTIDQPMCEMCYLKPVPDDTAARHQMMLLNRQRNAIDAEMRVLRDRAASTKSHEDIAIIESSLQELDRLRFAISIKLDKFWGTRIG